MSPVALGFMHEGINPNLFFTKTPDRMELSNFPHTPGRTKPDDEHFFFFCNVFIYTYLLYCILTYLFGKHEKHSYLVGKDICVVRLC